MDGLNDFCMDGKAGLTREKEEGVDSSQARRFHEVWTMLPYRGARIYPESIFSLYDSVHLFTHAQLLCESIQKDVEM